MPLPAGKCTAPCTGEPSRSISGGGFSIRARTVTEPVAESTSGAISLTLAVMARFGRSMPDRLTGASIAWRNRGESGVWKTASRPLDEASEITDWATPTIWPGSALREVTTASVGAVITVSSSARRA